MNTTRPATSTTWLEGLQAGDTVLLRSGGSRAQPHFIQRVTEKYIFVRGYRFDKRKGRRVHPRGSHRWYLMQPTTQEDST